MDVGGAAQGRMSRWSVGRTSNIEVMDVGPVQKRARPIEEDSRACVRSNPKDSESNSISRK